MLIIEKNPKFLRVPPFENNWRNIPEDWNLHMPTGPEVQERALRQHRYHIQCGPRESKGSKLFGLLSNIGEDYNHRKNLALH